VEIGSVQFSEQNEEAVKIATVHGRSVGPCLVRMRTKDWRCLGLFGRQTPMRSKSGSDQDDEVSGAGALEAGAGVDFDSGDAVVDDPSLAPDGGPEPSDFDSDESPLVVDADSRELDDLPDRLSVL